MMIPDLFVELYYGKHKTIDLHNLTKEEARANLIYELNSVDRDVKCLLVVHGYHGGTIIKTLVRKEFNHELISKKINLDAGRTIFVLFER